MTPFVHLHVHSQYSKLDGQASIPAMVEKAMADGMPGMALTDHGNMFGVKELHDVCNKKNAKINDQIKALKKQIGTPEAPDDIEQQIAALEASRFKPIFGCEVYVADTDRRTHVDKYDIGRHLILLAKNQQGYRNLIKIVSHAWTEGKYQHPRTDKSELQRYREGIICCSACLGGEVPRLILRGQINEAKKAVQWYKEVFGDDYYLELQRHKATVERAAHDTFPKQQEVNAVLIQFAQEMGIKLICTNDSHFVNQDDADAHERLILLSTGKTLADENTMLYTKQEWFKTQQEMNEVFADIPEALENTLEVLNKVEFYTIDHKPILPDFPLPEGFDNEDDYLRHLVYEGAARRWPELDEEHRERLEFELETIKNMGFPGYFLIVQDYIRMAPKLGCSVGPGRGSAAGSAVAYCLGITNIDPIKYDLLFERFLNPDRISLPDIDVDFDDDGRVKVLQYVTEKYGAEKVAHIITYGTMAAKQAIKDMARVEGLSRFDSDRLSKMIPASPNEMPLIPGDKDGKRYKITINNCVKCFPEFAGELQNPNPLVGETIRIASKLEGNVRNTGVHACGVIICRDDITDWVPISTATDSTGESVIVTQYEGSVIESTGLIKMDFLGLKNLSIIRDALANIKQTRGIDIDIEAIPIDDPKTFQLFCEGRTTGTFQFESPGMQKNLIQLQPSTFEDLIAMNALYRPGPMDYIPDFIARKHGQKPIVYDIPCMEQYLKDTYGITVYQEQVMLLSRLLAGFTRGQSDTLRKAMGKKQISKMQELETLFYEGGQKNGYDKEVLEKIWNDWKKFASYAFNKSHATCYSWVAYQTAYLKANYPSEYMAALLTRNRSDIKSITKFMDECKAMGIRVLGPDVNESFQEFAPNEQGNIRFGLAAIKGVSSAAVDAVVAERLKAGPFADIYNFLERINLSAFNRKALESLALAGAFDSLGIDREAFFAVDDRGATFSETLIKFAQRLQSGKASMQNSLFGDDETIEVAHPPIPKVEPWYILERLNKERELIGMYLSAHPLDPFYIEVRFGCTPLSEIANLAEQLDQDITFGGLVVEYDEKTSNRGGKFGIMKIEDYSGSMEIRLFGQNFIDFAKYGRQGTPILVHGRYQKRRYGDQIDFNVTSMQLLEQVKGTLVHSIMLTMPIEQAHQQIHLIDSAIGKTKTHNCQILLNIVDHDNNSHVILQSRQRLQLDKQLVDNLETAGIPFEANPNI